MKNIFGILFFAAAIAFGASLLAQNRAPAPAAANRGAGPSNSGAMSTNSQRVISPDARQLIASRCGPRMAAVQGSAPPGRLVTMCSIDGLSSGLELGPFEELARRATLLFKQFRILIYVGAAFLLLWMIARAQWKTEGEWEKLIWLVVGLVAVALAEFFLRIGTGKFTIEEVRGGAMFVDCRRQREALYKCQPESRNSRELDQRFIIQFTGPPTQGGAPRRTSVPGLF